MKRNILILLGIILMAHTAFGLGKIKVLIVDGFSNHDWSYTTEIITAMLERSGFCEIDISTAPLNDDPGYHDWRPDFSTYDVIIQNTNNYSIKEIFWPERVKKDLEDYMNKGGGLYVFHSGNNAFAEWAEYDRMIGLGWRKTEQGDAVEIVDGNMVRIPAGVGPGTSHGPRRTLLVENLKDHPINKGFPGKWLTPDMELYVYARGPAENLQVLSYTYDSITDKNWPVDWVVHYGEGRVYNSTFGHLWHEQRMPESIQCIGFQTTFMRAIQWLAGKKVSYRVPQNFPSVSEISIQPLELVYRDIDGWESLYNGENLEGWQIECLPSDREKTFWTSKGDYMECNSMGRPDHNYYWLMSEGEYTDFQLRLEFQVFENSNGNSGVQFRSRFDGSDEISEGGWLNGPQVDIHSPSPLRTGLIYDETRGVQRWIYPSLPDWVMVPDSAPEQAHMSKLFYADKDPDAWNSLELICQGMQIRTFVNGSRVTRFDADGILNDALHKQRNVGNTGHIALQLHANDELLIRFRKIYIRKMSTYTVSNK